MVCDGLIQKQCRSLLCMDCQANVIFVQKIIQYRNKVVILHRKLRENKAQLYKQIIMRKGAFIAVLVLIAGMVSFSTAGCSDRKAVPADSVAVDSDSVMSTDTMSTIISETPMPKTADELFDDFFFNFAANRKLQYSRIKFPLTVNKYGKSSELPSNKWKMEHFFMKQDYYTLIFDSQREMKVVKDTTVSHVVVERINLSKSFVKQFVFDRIQGKWMLTSVDYKKLGENNNSSFLKFYKTFAADSAFQVHSVNDPLQFSGPDPDDEFSNMTGILAPEQWPSFAPELPRHQIYNILYGQKYGESKRKIFVMRGISNGLETELTFERRNGHWKLTKLSM